jgi:lipopolysaccharide export system protein LptC
MDAATHHDPASLWAPRRQLTLAQARKRSERVRMLRMLFVACAAVSIGFFAGHVIKSALTSDSRPVSVTKDASVTMLNPRFTGRDSTGQSFQITADAARRRRAEDQAVDLVSPVLTDEAGSRVSAPSGMYDRAAGILELYDDVSITDASGYTFVSTGARVYVGEGRVEGLSPLQGKGPLGDIRCDSYEVLEDGNRIVCAGNVRTVIYPAPAEEALTEMETTGEGDTDGSN